MIHYKQLFGYAAIVFSFGFFVRSFVPAHAFNGAHVSLGSNPIDSGYGYNGVIFTNNSSSDFVITDIGCENDGPLTIGSSNVFYCLRGNHQLQSGLIVPAGTSVSTGANNRNYFISGYYTH